MKTIEEYLNEYSVTIMGGKWVPIHIATKAAKQLLDGELRYMGGDNPPLKEELNLLVRQYSKKYPDGEFSFSPMYSYDGTHVEGVLCFDWKCQVYHIENEPIECVIKLIKGLKK